MACIKWGLVWILVGITPLYGTPVVEWILPKNLAIVDSEEIPVTGRADNTRTLLVNGTSVRLGFRKSFHHTVDLAIGPNTLSIWAGSGKTNDELLHTRTVFRLKTFEDVALPRVIRYFVTAFDIDGYRDTPYFYATQPITRAEASVWVIKALGLSPSAEPHPLFEDVSPTHWAYPYLSTVSKRGILVGINRRQFVPDGWLTRLDAVVSTLRLHEPQLVKSSSAIASDIPDQFWGNRYLATAKKLDLLPEKWQSDTFKPFVPTTRLEWIELLVQVPEIRHRINRYFSKPVLPIASSTQSNQTPLSTGPKIRQLWSTPDQVQVDGPHIVKLFAQVDPPSSPIKTVHINLKTLGRLENMELRDDGSWGDDVANDYIYSGQVTLPPGLIPGEKWLPVSIESEDQSITEGEITINLIAPPPSAPVTPPTSPPKPPIKPSNQYVVQRGDTLPKISRRRYGSTRFWRQIAQENGIEILETQTDTGKTLSYTHLTPGQILILKPVYNQGKSVID